LQLYHSVDAGYFDARTLKFVGNSTNATLEWLRLPGDVLFIAGGVLPLVWMGLQGVIHRGSHHDALTDDDLLLFTEVEDLQPDEATAAGTLTAGP
jgi:nitric oxide reductase subunit B